MWMVHKEDKCEKGKKMTKMGKARKEKRGGKNINNAYHAFLCALIGEDSDEFFFSEDNGLEGEASDSDDEADDEYYSENSNTSE